MTRVGTAVPSVFSLSLPPIESRESKRFVWSMSDSWQPPPALRVFHFLSRFIDGRESVSPRARIGAASGFPGQTSASLLFPRRAGPAPTRRGASTYEVGSGGHIGLAGR